VDKPVDNFSPLWITIKDKLPTSNIITPSESVT